MQKWGAYFTNVVVSSYVFVRTSLHLLSGVKKAVPLHAMEALEGRRGIAPTHS
jgi:hypothetical protein